MIMRRVLTAKFYNRNTELVARELIGKFLVRKIGEEEWAAQITEVEVYDGFDDSASHAHKGVTSRTRVMFGEPGYWYVYLCYGIHFMVNIVTREKGYPAAILIRGVRGAQGPGRVTCLLHITRDLNSKKSSRGSGLWIEDRGVVILPENMYAYPRVGIEYAAEDCKNRLWRFVLTENSVS